MVDSRAFDHEEEALVAVSCRVAERAHSRLGHLLERRVDVVLVPAVNLVRDVGVCEEAQHRQVDVRSALELVEARAVVRIAESLLLGQRNDVLVIRPTRILARRVGQEVTSTTTQHQIHHATKRVIAHQLLRNAILLLSHIHMRRKARRRRIRDPRRDHQARHVSRLLRRLEHRPTRLVVRRHRYRAIVALLSARERSRTRRGVCNQRRGRARARLPDKVLVDNELLAEGRAVLELHEAARQAQTRGAHAVRDHEDEVALAAWVRAAGLGVAVSLVDDCEDDDGGGCDDGPHEEPEFSPKLPRSRTIRSALGGLAGEEGVFFGNVAVAAGIAGGPVREKGSHVWLVVMCGCTRESLKRKKKKSKEWRRGIRACLRLEVDHVGG